MTTPSRTRAGRLGLLVVVVLILVVAVMTDLARDGSFLRAVFAPGSSETPAESTVRGVRGGLPHTPR